MPHRAKSYHSVCAWTFNAGKGGFTPPDIRPAWDASRLGAPGVIELVVREIAPRLPSHIELGLELHYDFEVDERNAADVASALQASGLSLAMLTPGAHRHFAYGGIASLDPEERARAEALGERTVDLAYDGLRPAWHAQDELAPSLVIWNGSFGYDLGSIGVREMYRNMLAGLAKLCEYEARHGGAMYIGLEPKPNEGHPAMLLPTVASALVAWHLLFTHFGVDPARKGINKEFGHSEMAGLDHVHDTVEELECGALVHMHLNSQGLNDGLVLGGPGRYDIDHGVRINGLNIAVAGLLSEAGYGRWKGHDMQPRPYDNEAQAVDRVVRSILSWEACERAAEDLDTTTLLDLLSARETARAEDLLRSSVMHAQRLFGEMYG